MSYIYWKSTSSSTTTTVVTYNLTLSLYGYDEMQQINRISHLHLLCLISGEVTQVHVQRVGLVRQQKYTKTKSKNKKKRRKKGWLKFIDYFLLCVVFIMKNKKLNDPSTNYSCSKIFKKRKQNKVKKNHFRKETIR